MQWKPGFFGAPIQLRMVYALIASLLWWAIVESERDPMGLPFYAAGAVFAALVLVPFLPDLKGANKLRALALLLCGALSYWSAVAFLMRLDDVGAIEIGLAGVCGALIVGIGARLFVPLVLRWHGWLMLVGAGFLGGIVLHFGYDAGFGMSPHYEYWLPGHVAWEVFVCLALYYGSERSEQLRAMDS
jgi:hypothetical protein